VRDYFQKHIFCLIFEVCWSILIPCWNGMIAENLKNLQIQIEQACQRSGRRREDIQLIAVSKTFPPAMIEEAVQAGQLDFGENYVQELREKQQDLITKPVRWHFIGHLQKNKVKYIADYIHLIHSVDEIDLGKEISKRAGQLGRIQNVLVEVHTTDEATKYGVQPNKAIDLIRDLSRLSHLRVQGLMTMGPFADDPNASRPSFQQVAELAKRIETEEIENVAMKHLSMGMTHDFEVAIEEGATMIRVGTAIFGKRSKNEIEEVAQ
jgi:pyridoxal phosphate enzyme (YggS family)